MNSPTDKLEALANEAKNKIDEEIISEWSKVIFSLRIAEEGMAGDLTNTYGDGDVELFSHYMTLDIPQNGYLGTTHVIKVEPGQEVNPELMQVNLEVSLFKSGKAYLSCSSDNEDLDDSSLYLEGTYEEVVRRLIEINNLVMSQLPELPDDLRQ